MAEQLSQNLILTKKVKDSQFPEQVKKRLLGGIERGSVTPLSEEKEKGCFTLYCLGDGLELVAEKSGYPIEIIIATSIMFDWEKKAQYLHSLTSSMSTAAIQQEILKNTLTLTLMHTQNELKEVLAGNKSTGKSDAVPKKIADIEKLFQLAQSMEKPEESPQNAEAVETETLLGQILGEDQDGKD